MPPDVAAGRQFLAGAFFRRNGDVGDGRLYGIAASTRLIVDGGRRASLHQPAQPVRAGFKPAQSQIQIRTRHRSKHQSPAPYAGSASRGKYQGGKHQGGKHQGSGPNLKASNSGPDSVWLAEYQGGVDAAKGEVIVHDVFGVNGSPVVLQIIQFCAARVYIIQIQRGNKRLVVHHFNGEP